MSVIKAIDKHVYDQLTLAIYETVKSMRTHFEKGYNSIVSVILGRVSACRSNKLIKCTKKCRSNNTVTQFIAWSSEISLLCVLHFQIATKMMREKHIQLPEFRRTYALVSAPTKPKTIRTWHHSLFVTSTPPDPPC